MERFRWVGVLLCLCAVVSMVGCAFGPVGKFDDKPLKTAVEEWTAEDWTLASLGFILGFITIPVGVALGVGWALH